MSTPGSVFALEGPRAQGDLGVVLPGPGRGDAVGVGLLFSALDVARCGLCGEVGASGSPVF